MLIGPIAFAIGNAGVSMIVKHWSSCSSKPEEHVAIRCPKMHLDYHLQIMLGSKIAKRKMLRIQDHIMLGDNLLEKQSCLPESYS